MKARWHITWTHAVTSAAVGVACYLGSVLMHLHDPFWAVVAALVVIQDDWKKTREAAFNRFIGTSLGGLLGWAAAVAPGPVALSFGAAVAVGVGICYLLRVGDAGRLCAVTITIIVLIPRDVPAHIVALHRFLEVTFGMAFAVGWVWIHHRLVGDLESPGSAAASQSILK